MAVVDEDRYEPTAPRLTVPAKPRFDTPVVPRNSIAGRALVAVVAIMTFLASLTTGAVILVGQAAGEWQTDVAREVTIQVVPAAGRDTDAIVDKAAAIARGFPGIGDVRVFSKDESIKLLEPWLGSGLTLSELPVPRLIVVRLASGASVDMARLNRLLIDQAPGAMLDDHRGWIDRMRAMAGSVVAGGVAILILMFAATVLSVTFATRGAMATNKNVIEVLHLVGAKNGFIANNFQRHFLMIGLEGGAIGGGAAVVVFLVAAAIGYFAAGTAGGDQSAALFGSFSLGFFGYAAVLTQVAISAAVTALTSRHTVNRTLEAMD
ncbi:MAG: ABC transporter permease [Pseudolabrys sp.]|jgi:cell division transport system permease protein